MDGVTQVMDGDIRDIIHLIGVAVIIQVIPFILFTLVEVMLITNMVKEEHQEQMLTGTTGARQAMLHKLRQAEIKVV
jgi:hypothetical protein